MNSLRKFTIRPAVAIFAVTGTALAGAAGGVALADTVAPGNTGNVLASGPSHPVTRIVGGQSLADMVETVAPSVVQIHTVPKARLQRLSNSYDQQDLQSRLEGLFGNTHPGLEEQPGPAQTAHGSGFIIDPSGLVLTNNHVVQGAEAVLVKLSDGRELTGRVLGRDPKTDVAVVRIEGTGPFQSVRWGNSGNIRVGDSVFAVGSPFGLGNSVTSGIVSALGREIGAGPYDDFLQVDAAINSGNSGGPLFDASGAVIGINTAIFSPTGGNVGIGFAIPAHLAQKIAKQIVEHGGVSRGRIGVALQNVSPDTAEALKLDKAAGALISDVEPGGPASAAGLAAGDVVRRFGGSEVEDGRDLARAVADAPVGQRVPITVIRSGRPLTTEVNIESDRSSAA